MPYETLEVKKITSQVFQGDQWNSVLEFCADLPFAKQGAAVGSSCGIFV